MGDAWQLSIGEASSRIRARTLSVVELIDATLARIHATDSSLHPYAHVFGHEARREAEQADDDIDSGRYRGALHGIPIAVKDIIDLGPTECGSQVLRGRLAEEPAPVVTALTAAGAIVVGKSRTYEFAVGTCTHEDPLPPPENPWRPGFSPGGSSNGSAVAVAAGAAAGAVGTDTGGSIRWPASACGIVGLQPTFDLVSRRGVFPLAWSLDHVGPLARTVDDAGLMLGAMVTDAARLRIERRSRTLARSARDRRVAIPSSLLEGTCDAGVLEVLSTARRTLVDAGFQVVDVRAPFEAGDLMAAIWIVILAESAAVHSELLHEQFDAYGPELRHYLRAGRQVTAEDYLVAQRFRSSVRSWCQEIFQGAGLILVPTGGFRPEPIPIVRRSPVGRTELPLYAVLSNLAVLPSIGVPAGFGRDGLPVGLTLIAPAHREDRLLAVGRLLEWRGQPRHAWETP